MSVDLHIHTTASDGSLTPEETVQKAHNLGYSAIGITDHDTVIGLDPALEKAKNMNIEIVPGIEINTEYRNHEVHILGYYIDYKNKKLLKKLKELKKARVNRIKKIVAKLNELDIKITTNEVLNLANEGAVGRTHIAKILCKKGYVDSIHEAFKKYIAINKPAYVKRYRLTPVESINIIKKCDGIPVLAHPGLVKNDSIVKQIIDMEIEGLEVYYYEHNQEQTKKYYELAQRKNLLITGGSDDHGPNNKDGARLGKMRLDYNLVKQLKKRIKNNL